jgi:hypothetical protein
MHPQKPCTERVTKPAPLALSNLISHRPTSHRVITLTASRMGLIAHVRIPPGTSRLKSDSLHSRIVRFCCADTLSQEGIATMDAALSSSLPGNASNAIREVAIHKGLAAGLSQRLLWMTLLWWVVLATWFVSAADSEFP